MGNVAERTILRALPTTILRRGSPEVDQQPLAPPRVVGGRAQEAQLGFAMSADDSERCADGAPGLTRESLSIRRLPDGLGGACYQHVIVVRSSLGDD